MVEILTVRLIAANGSMLGGVDVHKVALVSNRPKAAAKSLRVLVVRRGVQLPSEFSHAAMGRLLGIPCSSDDPWGPGNNVFYEVDIVASDDCYSFAPRENRRASVTTFFCKDQRAAKRFFAAFKQRAKAFTNKHLAPANLAFCLRMHTHMA